MKTIFFLLAILISIQSYCQWPFGTPVDNDTLFVADLSSTDTTVFKKFRAPNGGGVTFTFTYVDAQDATLAFGYSNDGTVLWPEETITVDNTNATYKGYDANGNVKYGRSYHTANWRYDYIGWYFSKGSLTNDTIVIQFDK